MINQNLLLAGDDAYNIQRSLRFRSSASAYLNRTPASASNRQIFTYSAWIKRGALSNGFLLYTNPSGGSGADHQFVFFTSDSLRIGGNVASAIQFDLITSAVFRDPSAWYHIVIVFDTTQATASNRIKLYVNGSQVTSFSSATYPAQNANTNFNSTNPFFIGAYTIPTQVYFDGYMAEVNWIDGQALTPSSFGMNDPQTGVWEPKKYTGTYGTNGFYLNFSDNSNNTAATIGKDYSGNGNNWTPNNISVTSGSTYDSMTDVPTLTSESAANYCVLNPLDFTTVGNITEANLRFAQTTLNARSGRATIGVSSGKWYWEVTNLGGNNSVGIGNASMSLGTYCGGDANGWSYFIDGNKYNNNGATAYGASYTTNDIIGVALDMDAGTLVFYKNNVSQGTAYSSLTGTMFPAFSSSSVSNVTFVANFGQRPFAYTPPTGFKALNTFNLPTPTIGATASTQANKYFNTVLWTGDGASTRAITGLSHAPDFVWIKKRTAGGTVNRDHVLYDIIRGTGANLRSNQTNAESTGNTDELKSFDSDGFTLGSGDNVNGASGTPPYVGWAWKANGSGSSNTSGSITSTVSANTTAGFSIVTYTGDGTQTGKTVGHGLGVTPAMIIVKCRSETNNWNVWHKSLSSSTTSALQLSTNGAAFTDTYTWGSTAPTSSIFGVGTQTGGGVWSNKLNATFVAYCFAEVAGYSRFGSYTGNGSTDGPFIYTGFRPRFLLVKNSSTTGSWNMVDTARDTSNLSTRGLYPDISDAEDTSRAFDILSNGFKLRSSTAANTNGVTLIYAAFAENPFKYSLAR